MTISQTQIVERLLTLHRELVESDGGECEATALYREAAEALTKLTERCSGYRGQVEAGAAEIEASREEVKRLRNALEDAETALDAVLYENSDKSEADRIRDRVVAAVVLANARSALIGESTT